MRFEISRGGSGLTYEIRNIVLIANKLKELGMNIIWENLAEIRSLYVDDVCRKKGIGRKLVEFCISEAITLELFRIFSLTYKKEFFAKLGFKEVDRSILPEKIWSDCFRCSKYPDYCDEVAMIIEL